MRKEALGDSLKSLRNLIRELEESQLVAGFS
jgi:hypothetical protein